MNQAFDDLLGPEPAWNRCVGCGVETTNTQCWKCLLAEEEARERRALAAACGIPRAFEWAFRGSELLRQRVQSPRSLPELEAKVLGARRVYLQGAAGSGKTSLAIACLREFVPRAMFVRAEQLAKAPIQHKLGQGEAPLVAAAKAAHVLLLDDLGSDDPGDKKSAVQDVIFERHDRGKTTWITSGLGRAKVEELYGTGILRRVLSDGVMALRLGRPTDPEVP